MDALGYLKHLLDPDRLKVVGLVAVEPRSADELSGGTGLTRRDVLECLAPLVRAGIVAEDGGTYRLVSEALRDLARELPQPAPPDRSVFHGMTEGEAQVLARFFRGERLTEIPASRSKRLVVLERIALEFEPGVRYPEAAVNEIVGSFHLDHAALRRHLVDEGFLDRDSGEYWRSGGRVAAADASAGGS
jgi:hypothetical protein